MYAFRNSNELKLISFGYRNEINGMLTSVVCVILANNKPILDFWRIVHLHSYRNNF